MNYKELIIIYLYISGYFVLLRASIVKEHAWSLMMYSHFTQGRGSVMPWLTFILGSKLKLCCKLCVKHLLGTCPLPPFLMTFLTYPLPLFSGELLDLSLPCSYRVSSTCTCMYLGRSFCSILLTSPPPPPPPYNLYI